jgi:hypothetical protein
MKIQLNFFFVTLLLCSLFCLNGCFLVKQVVEDSTGKPVAPKKKEIVSISKNYAHFELVGGRPGDVNYKRKGSDFLNNCPCGLNGATVQFRETFTNNYDSLYSYLLIRDFNLDVYADVRIPGGDGINEDAASIDGPRRTTKNFVTVNSDITIDGKTFKIFTTRANYNTKKYSEQGFFSKVTVRHAVYFGTDFTLHFIIPYADKNNDLTAFSYFLKERFKVVN